MPQKHAHAQQPDFAEIPLESLHDGRPIAFAGLMSSQTLDIPLPQNWLIGEENWMEVRFRASPLLDRARSSITVTLNGYQINSYNLAALPESRQRIVFPSDLFTPGNNTLTFLATLYLPDDPGTNCRNWDDPARWLAIEPDGLLHLTFSGRDSQADLANFPQTFVEPLEKYMPEQRRQKALIVLPDNSTADDLTSLSTLSYLLGHYGSPGYQWSPDIVNAGNWNRSLAANRNIIFIGETPLEFQDKVSQDGDYVGLFSSPWNAEYAVMLIGDRNRQDGFTPASVFSDPTRSILLHGNIAYVDRQSPAVSRSFQKKYSFKDLGYRDRTVSGVGQQSLTYRFYLPYDVEPVLAKLKLDLFHSPNLSIENSYFTVYLNGFSIAAILPGARGSSGEPIKIGLPAKRFRPGLNFIRVSFDLHVSQSSCEHSLEGVWGTVLSSSTIETSYRKRTPIPSLEHFPLPFSDAPGSLLVIPEQFQPGDLSHLSQLSFMLGASAVQGNHPPEVSTATNFQPRASKYLNIILVGTPLDNPITGSINDVLPQPFSEDGHSLQEGYGVRLPTPDRQASLGLVQILPSPWVRGGTVLVLSGNDPQGLDWSWNVLLDPASRNQFAGNLMVVGPANRSQNPGETVANPALQTLFQQVADAGNIPLVGPLLQKYGQDFLAPALAAVATALLLVIGTFWVIELWKSRSQRPSKEAALRNHG